MLLRWAVCMCRLKYILAAKVVYFFCRIKLSLDKNMACYNKMLYLKFVADQLLLKANSRVGTLR